jgi:hypothetical protein
VLGILQLCKKITFFNIIKKKKEEEEEENMKTRAIKKIWTGYIAL